MTSRSSRAWGRQVTLAAIAWGFPGRRQALSRLAPQLIEIERLRQTTSYALIPQLPQPLEILLSQLVFELPIADSLTYDFAGCRIFPGFDSSLKSSYLLPCQGDTHLMDIRH